MPSMRPPGIVRRVAGQLRSFWWIHFEQERIKHNAIDRIITFIQNSQRIDFRLSSIVITRTYSPSRINALGYQIPKGDAEYLIDFPVNPDLLNSLLLAFGLDDECTTGQRTLEIDEQTRVHVTADYRRARCQETLTLRLSITSASSEEPN